MAAVAITGIGMVIPLGSTAQEVLDRIERGETAARKSPSVDAFACPLYAPVADFDAERHFPDNKTLRLMNRDAQMAVVAARWALADAGIAPDTTYPSEDIALYGATGLSGMPMDDIRRLVENAAAPDGSLDLGRFGQVALKRIRPVLSFKILANMPICFVSIFENLRGPNAVYTPWEGQGAQAIAAGIRAVGSGEVPCALVGGCDVKTHVLSLVSLRQLGVFDSWTRYGRGVIPGEGAAFVVLEDHDLAMRRGARVRARVRDFRLYSLVSDSSLPDALTSFLPGLHAANTAIVSACDGDPSFSVLEREGLLRAGVKPSLDIKPKPHTGNLFAAAAATQVALAAELATRMPADSAVLANCLGPGMEQGVFLLEAA